MTHGRELAARFEAYSDWRRRLSAGISGLHEWLSQQELADRIGVTRQTVNAIELGKYSPSLEVAFRIAENFGVPLDEVFQYNGGPKSRSRK